MSTVFNSYKHSSGFTLIEIIVALLVISVALATIISTIANSVAHGTHMKEKTIAMWVAKNHITEYVITKQWPETGQQSHETSMAGTDWFLNSKIIQTPDINIRRLELSVFRDRTQENKVLTLITYLTNPTLYVKKKT